MSRNLIPTRYVSYKARTYVLLFLGDTKYGRRAHLAFSDGSKDFWVGADLVIETADPPAAARRAAPGDRPVRGCAQCRQLGRMCPRCEFDEYDC